MFGLIKRLGLVIVATALAVTSVAIPAAGLPVSSAPTASTTLADVAATHGMSEARLTKLLAQDKRLRIGRGRLMFTDATPAELGAGPDAAEGASGAALSAGAPALSDAFALHSRPGAKKLIYLDFDGTLISGTAWNDSNNGGADIVAPAWDIDGNPSAFGDTERARIIEVWQRVSEDYAPFDVDVTTDYPGEDALNRTSSSDDAYGMRVLVSPISSYFGNYGGVAYIGVYDLVSVYYRPALVFPEMLANNAKYIAEACSHECGHTLGLLHDGTTAGVTYYSGHGTGETGWAPIMGNSYYKNVTQWSKGEYALASNTEDDFAKIVSHGLSFRTDDVGNTAADASALPSTGSFTVGGLIEQSGDVDTMRFTTGAGTVTLNVAPAGIGPNLDVLARLYDASGVLVAESNPVDLLSASISAVVPAGTYFLSVSGTGKGDASTGYSSYAVLGQYTVSGTTVPTVSELPPVAVAAGSPLAGVAPVNVQFDSFGSYDSDGSIVSYAWDFGDGATSSAANPQHLYGAAGNYTARLTVTDNTGLTGTAAVTVNVVAPNALPVAAITASGLSGTAPFTPQFSGSGSYDPDGSIVSYAWDFGDGAKATGQTASHTFSAAGTYVVRLTVTDNEGATASTSANVKVSAPVTQIIRVASIQVSILTSKFGNQGKAVVKVTTPDGLPVSGVAVTGAWAGIVTGTSTATTDSSGNATLLSKRVKKAGTVSITVTALAKSGYAYDPSQNAVVSASVSGGRAIR